MSSTTPHQRPYSDGMFSSTPAQRPRGIGVAVVFDWALAVQLASQAAAAATGHLGLARSAPAIAGRLLAAVLLLALGEGVRRGASRLRLVQVAMMLLVTVLGVGSAALLLAGRGDRSLVLSAIVELTYAPWIAWRFSTKDTVRWFTIAAGRRRAPRASGPAWVTVLAGWSVLWGVAVAWSQSL